MNDSALAIRTHQSNNLSTKTKGRFCSANRIQKLIAPARELIQAAGTLKHLLDFLRRANQPKALENARKLKPNFLEYWRKVCELIKKEILARYELFIQVRFQRVQIVQKENSVKSQAGISLKPKYGNKPPKRFIPLPDAEIGGCARNDSLIAPAIN
jgi:hypothetical protein